VRCAHRRYAISAIPTRLQRIYQPIHTLDFRIAHPMIPRVKLLLVFAAALAAFSILPAQEQSVRPGINDRYQHPDLADSLKRFEREGRDIYDRRDAILAACGLKPGISVADIGAGTGLFTRLFAREVGPQGVVHAVDISEAFLAHITNSCATAGITNVLTTVCAPDDARLPAGCADFAFVCDTYHHFEFPAKTMASIHRALRPGARLVLIDFERIEGTSAQWILDHVRAGKDVFRAEIEAAGFEFIEEKQGLLQENYFLVFRKNAAAR
jgi:predicted methyltransferase